MSCGQVQCRFPPQAGIEPRHAEPVPVGRLAAYLPHLTGTHLHVDVATVDLDPFKLQLPDCIVGLQTG